MTRIWMLVAWVFLTAGAVFAEDTPPMLGAHGLRLPATFTGTLPCADCAGVAHHLDLWPDQTYHMRRMWEGREPQLARDEVGRWYADPERQALVLHGASEAPIFWQIKGHDRLRQMDLEGRPIDSDLPLELTGIGHLEEADLSLTLQGMFIYFADAALFEVCLTGRTYPVAMEGPYIDLERAYLEQRPEPGVPMMAVVDGTLAMRPAMEGPPRRSLVVTRFAHMVPEASCERHKSQASLKNTYWRIRMLDGVEIATQPGGREPFLLLRDGDEARYQATVGCNGMGGSFVADGPDGVRFARGMSTLMACPDPLGDWENRLGQVLESARRWEIAGQALVLKDDAGGVLASFDAVYLP